ncbi:MAG: hypothetical protein IJ828_02140 [Treponema sp.]|nr:hypothetical protein [Treponema sp.]
MNKKIIAVRTILTIAALTAIFLPAFIISKRQAAKQQEPWYSYHEQEHNARIYMQNTNDTLFIVACLSIAGIDCSIHLNHSCSSDQFLDVQNILRQNKASYTGIVSEPDTDGYPNLTDYLPLVMSSDEMHQMWQLLHLE